MPGLGGLFGGILGGLCGGITDGLKKGLAYIAETEKISLWAIRTNNTAALADAAHVSALWLQEVYDQTGNIPEHLIQDLISGADPFAGSRLAAQALQSKYAAEAGAWFLQQPRA